MIAAPFLALLLQAGAQPAATASPPPAELPPEAFATLFLYFRANAYHEMATARGCGGHDPDRMSALEARRDALRRRLADQFGAARIETGARAPGDPGPGDCDITLMGYDNALNELEQHMRGAAK